jgi:hypothetical protein
MWLAILNELMADWEMDGIRLGYFPQSDLSAQCSLQDVDIRAVKLRLVNEFAGRNGVSIDPEMGVSIASVYSKIFKRSIRYVESNNSEPPRPQDNYSGRNHCELLRREAQPHKHRCYSSRFPLAFAKWL